MKPQTCHHNWNFYVCILSKVEKKNFSICLRQSKAKSKWNCKKEEEEPSLTQLSVSIAIGCISLWKWWHKSNFIANCDIVVCNFLSSIEFLRKLLRSLSLCFFFYLFVCNKNFLLNKRTNNKCCVLVFVIYLIAAASSTL